MRFSLGLILLVLVTTLVAGRGVARAQSCVDDPRNSRCRGGGNDPRDDRRDQGRDDSSPGRPDGRDDDQNVRNQAPAQATGPHSKYQGCSDSQSGTIESALPRLPGLIQDLQRSVSAALRQGGYSNPESEQGLQEAERILQCMRGTVSHLTIACDESVEPFAAETNDLSVRFARPAFVSDFATIFLHEVTHTCGTVDGAYFTHPRVPPQDSDGVPWADIADTYKYWADFGFCVPGENCGGGSGRRPRH